MPLKDVSDRSDIEQIVTRFYDAMLVDPIIGYIFTDVVKIDLAQHLPIIVDFWADSLWRERSYSGNTLQKHLEISAIIQLTPGHFTRWLYLFERAVDAEHDGINAKAMKARAEMVAKSISAAIARQKRDTMELVLPKNNEA